MTTFILDRKSLFPVATHTLKPARTVLDIGCGIQPQKYVPAAVHVCVEPFQQYIQVLQKKCINTDNSSYIFINTTWQETADIFPPKSIDTVFLGDVIEHIEKEAAKELLRKTETIAAKQIAVFTPLGFMPQEHPDGKDAWGLDGGAWQEHKSGWFPEDFDDTWDLFVCPEYHLTDSHGEILPKPHGALWAIKSFHEKNIYEKAVLKTRIAMYSLINRLRIFLKKHLTPRKSTVRQP